MKIFKNDHQFEQKYLELLDRCARAEAALFAEKEKTAVWKERGDKYANHNDELQESLKGLHNTHAEIMKGVFTFNGQEAIAAYREALQAMHNKKPTA